MKLDGATRLLLELTGPRPAVIAGACPVSWRDVEVRAVDLGLGPLLDHGIRRGGIANAVPAEIREHLAGIRRLTAVRNTVLLHALRRIEAAAAEMALPLIVLKGGDFVQTLYPDPSLRVLIDLDVLLARKDALRLEARLPRLGFSTDVDMDHEWFEQHLHHGLAWHGADGAVTLEVHWNLTRPSDPFAFPVTEMFAASEPSGTSGAARRLSSCDSLEYLAAHIFRHLTTPDGAVRSLIDAAWLLDGPDGRRIDWNLLQGRASERGTAVPLALMFEVLDALYPQAGHGEHAREFGRRVERRDLSEARNLMEAMFAMPVRQPPAIVAGLTGLGQAGGIGAKARFLGAGLFPKTTDMNRDLTREAARLPFLLRYGTLLTGYMKEFLRIGPDAAAGAYRLGRLRRRLRDRQREPSP